MAEAASFAESNVVFDPPEGVSPDEIFALSGYVEQRDGHRLFITCWKLTPEELSQVNKTGRIWVGQLGQQLQPLWVDGLKPFGCAAVLNGMQCTLRIDHEGPHLYQGDQASGDQKKSGGV